MVEMTKELQSKAAAKGVKLLLPVDNVTVDSFDFGAMKADGNIGSTDENGNIPDGWEGVDIGPKTTELYCAEVAKSKTVLWNGPMGIFESDDCNKGTFAVAKAIADNEDAITIIGGGDSVTAVNKSGYGDKVSFMSTGGGASLEFLEGKTLPGVAALEDK